MRLLALASVLLLVGCGGSAPSGPGAVLAGSSWSVERIVYASGEVIRGDGETIAFGADGSVSMASCNTCQGRYRARRGTLSIDETLRCTRKACRPGEIQIERFLSGPQTIERDGPYLVLTAQPDEDREGTAPQPPSVLLLPNEAPQAMN
ncbi:MAG: META domain-containing protein [Bacteroidota bacterium]